ncbi:MAG: hypothetical protein A2029_10560 [Chloroflexi bacterium RBG_19FT_COMBO_47_9]|nr:MAG: hypothetical protein A2Y53_06285 [Chloroflexi bacterium RBG_16_47_49]OGO60745.1 MAG: hypothetical protein A2029_10560 [Chloroflexi bacterium RBG_19FT_COMBO_47_9]
MEKSINLSNQGSYLRVNNIKMYFEKYGVGTPIIILHGGLETCQMWTPIVSTLAKQFQVITPDSRGHGRTDESDEQISYPLMVEDFVNLIKQLELDRPFVVGYSDGGQVAKHMAINYPGLARGYLIGGIFNSITFEWRFLMQNLLGFEGSGMVNTERVQRENPQVVHDLQAKHDIFHRDGYWKTVLIQSSQRWWSPTELTQADFSKITDPTLFWCGDRDVFCPPEQALEMYRMVNKSELAVIPNADHLTILLQIDIAVEIMLNFMNRVNRE